MITKTFENGLFYYWLNGKLLMTSLKNIDVKECLKKGDYIKINSWLKENIHKHGKMKSAEEIIKEIAGEGVNSKYYIEYLKNKFTDIYLK